jgi:hypothetical protein
MQTLTPAEAAGRIEAAFRLFLTFDTKQLPRFGDDISDVWKSFWAPVFVLPLHLWITLARDVGTPADAAPFLYRLVTELSTYAIDVVYWPLAMVMFADLLQRPEGYARYVSAYNWVAVPVSVIATGIVVTMGADGGTLGLPGVALLFWMLLFRIKLARKVFDCNIGIAVALTAGDFFLGQFVIAMRAGVLAG